MGLGAALNTNRMPSYGAQKRQIADMDETTAELRQQFAAEGSGFARAFDETFANDNNDLSDQKPLPEPKFPVLMLCVAIFLDCIDFLDLTGIGAIGVFVIKLIAQVLLFFWYMGKMRFVGFKRGFITASGNFGFSEMFWRWLQTPLVLVSGIEIVPFLQMLPGETIMVLLAHHKKAKIVRLFNEALDRLYEASEGGRLFGPTVAIRYAEGLVRDYPEETAAFTDVFNGVAPANDDSEEDSSEHTTTFYEPPPTTYTSPHRENDADEAETIDESGAGASESSASAPYEPRQPIFERQRTRTRGAGGSDRSGTDARKNSSEEDDFDTVRVRNT